MKNDKCHFGKVIGTTSLGERGQVVIPKEGREHLKLKTGDKFLVVEHNGKLILVQENAIRTLIKNITKHLK